MGKIFIPILGFIQNQKRASFLILAILIAVALIYFVFEKFLTIMIAIFGWLGLVFGVIWLVLIIWSFIRKKLSTPGISPAAT